jgi:hypothetical protein
MIEKGVVRRRRTRIVCNRQGGKKIEKGVLIRRSRSIVHNKHEKKYIKNKQRGEEDFTRV